MPPGRVGLSGLGQQEGERSLMAAYHHTQPGTFIRITVVFLTVSMLGLAGWLGSRDTQAIWFFLLMAGVMVLLLALFHSLTVEITQGELRLRFGVGLIRKKIALREVTAAEKVRNKWYWGWGVRLTPHGWLFCVSGYDAIQVTLQNGRKYRIGTDQPDRLYRAVDTALERFRSPLNAGGL